MTRREVTLLGTVLRVTTAPKSLTDASGVPEGGYWQSRAISRGEAGPTRVLGLDLSIGRTGWCLLVGGQPEAHGTFDLPDYQRKGESLAAFLGRRADDLARHVGLLVVTHRPEVVGYEFTDMARPHWSGGSKGREFHAVQGLSRAEGFLIASWPRIGSGVRLVAVPMTLAKRLAAGKAGANKDQVRLGLRYRGWDLTGWDDNAVDAAAVALAAREML